MAGTVLYSRIYLTDIFSEKSENRRLFISLLSELIAHKEEALNLNQKI